MLNDLQMHAFVISHGSGCKSDFEFDNLKN